MRAFANASLKRHKIVYDFLVSIGVPPQIAEEDAGGRTSCQPGNTGGVRDHYKIAAWLNNCRAGVI